MFQPPFCPNRRCSQHDDPSDGFCVRFGYYARAVAPRRVQRYRCGTCRRTFSRQTFRADYRDHRPDLNAAMFMTVASGVGIRQACRVHGISLRCGELKLRKLARHLRRFNVNARGLLGREARFHFDEYETFEESRKVRPLTVPVLIESESRFIVWAESESIRPRGRMTEKRRRAVEKAAKRHGERKNRAERAIRRTLRRGADMAPDALIVRFETDEKSNYPRLGREAFGSERLVHNRTSSKLPRTTWNPLFPINQAEALMRDILARLRRQSWLASKKRRFLDIWLHVHIAYRNYVRRRLNRDSESPAELLGFVPRRLRAEELLGWAQIWGRRSIHPLSSSGESIEYVASLASE